MSKWRIVGFVVLIIFCFFATIGLFSYMNSIEWYLLTLSGIGLSILYVVFVKVAIMNNLQRSKIISIVLMLIALPIFGYALIVVQIPQTTYSDYIEVHAVCSDGIPVFFALTLDFAAVGSFSAENPIHVHGIIHHVNISDFNKHVGAISFTYASGFESELRGRIPRDNFLSVKDAGNNEYYVDGDLIWHVSASPQLMILPPISGVVKMPHVGIGEPIIEIAPVSDTLAFRSNHTMEQLTYAAVGLSVIMLQPFFIAIFPNKPAKSSSSSLSQSKKKSTHRRRR